MYEYLCSILSNVISGVFLAIIFFCFRERVCPIPEIGGRWYFAVVTCESEYNPYKGMVLHYTAVISCEGAKISGSVEKYYEKSSTGEREYRNEHLTRGKIEGFLTKNYFSKDKVDLHVIEKNNYGREYTNYYKLKITSNNTMEGDFISTVAQQSGNSSWQRRKL